MTHHPLQTAAYLNSVKKGFWALPVSLPEKVALIHAELSELLETYRSDPLAPCPKAVPLSCEREELADVLLRTLDLAEYFCVDAVDASLGDCELLRGATPSSMIAWAHERVTDLLRAIDTCTRDRIVAGIRDLVNAIEDIADARGLDVWADAQTKHLFNLTRPVKHGRNF